MLREWHRREFSTRSRQDANAARAMRALRERLILFRTDLGASRVRLIRDARADHGSIFHERGTWHANTARYVPRS
jgi:hypothetical protein